MVDLGVSLLRNPLSIQNWMESKLFHRVIDNAIQGRPMLSLNHSWRPIHKIPGKRVSHSSPSFSSFSFPGLHLRLYFNHFMFWRKHREFHPWKDSIFREIFFPLLSENKRFFSVHVSFFLAPPFLFSLCNL